MHTYRFSNALGYTLEQMSEMHNASFSGYFMPIEMTSEMTADFWRVNSIDALRSVIMHDESGAFVGMARMGTRGKRGWCGGFGIVPDFRGSGASRLLAEQMVNVARASGLSSLQLEVLTQNVRALKLYERVGFNITRRLFGLELATTALPVAEGEAPQVERAAPERLLPQLANAARPCWDCELTTILNGASEAIITSDPHGRLSGLIVQRGKNATILATLLQSDLPDAALVELLRQAAGEASNLAVFNEPEESPFLARYRALGFNEFYSQYEMYMEL